MLKQVYTILLEKFLVDDITGDELSALLETLDDPAHEEDWKEKISAIYLNTTLHQLSDEVSKKKVLDYILHHDTETPVITLPPKKSNWFRYAAAAAILIMIGTGIYYFTQPDRKQTAPIAKVTKDILPGRNLAVLTLASGKVIVLDSAKGKIVESGNLKVTNTDGKLDYEGKAAAPEMHTLTTPKGGQYQVTLPDGTEVWLNAASSISYPTAFSKDARRVMVSGEVYFEVAKDAKKTFEVTVANHEKIIVHGTHFNVNAYEDEPSLNTTLLEGAVEILLPPGRDQDDRPVTLKPGQQAQLSTDIKVVNNADVEKVMAWKNGHFNFDGLSLQEAMRQLERWYDITVVYEKNVPAIGFYGELDRNRTLASLLAALKDVGVHFRIEGRTLIVQP